MHILWTNHAHETRVYKSKLKVDHYASRTNDESNPSNKKTTVCSTVVFSTETSENSSCYDPL